jgi:hypothetical protein
MMGVESNWVHSALGPQISLLCQPLGDYDDGEIGGMIGRGNRSTRRKRAPVPLCPPQTPYDCPDENPGSRLSYGTAKIRYTRKLSEKYVLFLSVCLLRVVKTTTRLGLTRPSAGVYHIKGNITNHVYTDIFS